MMLTKICLTLGFDSTKALNGLGYRNSTTFDGGIPSSMLGGAELLLKGQGMAADGPSNLPKYLITNLNNLAVYGDPVDGK